MRNFYITGDCHAAVFERIIESNLHKHTNWNLIILGDAGLNFFLNENEAKRKNKIQLLLSECRANIYCVRGNHEERPENLGFNLSYDPIVEGPVFSEPKYPNIKYFKDGYVYWLNEARTLVLGGAYSVDKDYRLASHKGEAWTGWFKDEQLSKEEMANISRNLGFGRYDLILSHTCPISWQPTDLFLYGFNQKNIDRTMENWLETIKNKANWWIWLFGHFHDSRIIRPNVEMFYRRVSSLDDIMNRWLTYPEDHSIITGINKDSHFYLED